ncbi:MAG: hypothetical protein WCJ97_10055 [Phycisphaerae bacterium]
MKNQYFGDVNDYRKYGLLRALKVPGNLPLGVCWMLTDNDGGRDGKKRDYLDNQEAYRHFDPPLYDWLCEHHDARQVGCIERSNPPLLGDAIFHAPILNNDRRDREDYFKTCGAAFQCCNLVFFDPDNGLEVPSVPKGREKSRKYVYWDEVGKAFSMGASMLIYQHFPRFVYHNTCTVNKAKALLVHTKAATVYTFSTPDVLFLLAVQHQHQNHFAARVAEIERIWKGQILVAQHNPSTNR